MAAFHGKAGRVSWDGTATSNVLSWSIEATCDVADATAMSAVAVAAATHWKDYEIGFNSWTATVECNLDDGGLDPDVGADLVINGATLILYEGITAQSVRKYTGVGIITGVSPSIDKDDIAKCTYTFQGHGALAVAASDYTPV
jgi:hypothetical protein